MLNFGELGGASRRSRFPGIGCLCSGFHRADISLFLTLKVADYIWFQGPLTFKAFLWAESWPAVLRTRCRSDYLQVAWCCVHARISVLSCPLCLLFILHFKPQGFLFPLNKPCNRHWAEERGWLLVTSFASDVRWTLISVVSSTRQRVETLSSRWNKSCQWLHCHWAIFSVLFFSSFFFPLLDYVPWF